MGVDGIHHFESFHHQAFLNDAVSTASAKLSISAFSKNDSSLTIKILTKLVESKGFMGSEKFAKIASSTIEEAFSKLDSQSQMHLQERTRIISKYTSHIEIEEFTSFHMSEPTFDSNRELTFKKADGSEHKVQISAEDSQILNDNHAAFEEALTNFSSLVIQLHLEQNKEKNKSVDHIVTVIQERVFIHEDKSKKEITATKITEIHAVITSDDRTEIVNALIIQHLKVDQSFKRKQESLSDGLIENNKQTHLK